MNRQTPLRRAAPRVNSHRKNNDEIEVFNGLLENLAVSDAELAALELLVGWGWLGQLIQTCGGSEADV